MITYWLSTFIYLLISTLCHLVNKMCQNLQSFRAGVGQCAKMNSRGLSRALVLVLLVSTAAAQKKKKPIIAALEAKWSQTSFVLEAAEYLNTESPDFFWSFVSDISDLSDFSTRTEAEKYEAVLDIAGKSLTVAQVDLLKFSLSLKTESPKVEMHSHLASDRGVQDLNCPVVFEWADRLSCDLPSQEQRRKSRDSSALKTYEIDHVCPYM